MDGTRAGLDTWATALREECGKVLKKKYQKHCCNDPCGVLTDYGIGNNELHYALGLHKAMSEAIPGFDPRIVIDTGRSGNPMARQNCSHWYVAHQVERCGVR